MGLTERLQISGMQNIYDASAEVGKRQAFRLIATGGHILDVKIVRSNEAISMILDEADVAAETYGWMSGTKYSAESVRNAGFRSGVEGAIESVSEEWWAEERRTLTDEEVILRGNLCDQLVNYGSVSYEYKHLISSLPRTWNGRDHYCSYMRNFIEYYMPMEAWTL